MRNLEIFTESEKYMPGGVNSPVRAFKDATIKPLVIKKGQGAILEDEEGRQYVDYVGAWGPMILGHGDAAVVDAIKATAEQAIAFGAPTGLELKLAKHICETFGDMEMVRMVNSGTEATMSAIRLARGYTGRDKIVKFAGCYHGHFDSFLVSAGSGVMTEGIPGSAGVPESSIRNTLIAEYNSLDSIRSIFNKHGEDIAAVIIEPVAGNMGVVPAKEEFLRALDRLCKSHGSLLVFDEVMTGFRVAYQGAKSLYGIKPDLVTIAKIMGGGLPCGAYGGRREIMEKLSPLGPVYQAGTMSGNPIVMAAGLATLTRLYENPQYYGYLETLAARLEEGIKEAAHKKGIPVVINRFQSMMTIFFNSNGKVENYEDAKKSDTAMYARYFEHMIKGGIYLSPSQFEAMFFSVKHTEKHIEHFIETFRGL